MAEPKPTADPAPAPTSTPAFDALIQRVLAGEAAAWTDFVSRVHPTVLQICDTRGFVGGFSDARDTAHDIAVRALDRLRASEFAALRSFVAMKARRPSASFVRWLAAIVGTTYVDYLRAQPEYQRRREESSRRLRRLPHGELDADATAADSSVDPLTAIEIRRIVDCLASDVFPQPQRIAIVLWLRGHDATEIAAALELPDAAAAHKLLHAARQRLRRAVHGGSA